MITTTAKPPNYTVIFTSILKDDPKGYPEEADTIFELAQIQPGYLGMESARNELGISVSYCQSLKAIKDWGQNTRHQIAKERGKSEFYAAFKTRICKVEMDY